MGELRAVEYQASCSILNELQGSDGRGRGTSQEGVAIVQAGDDKSLDEDLCRLLSEEWVNPPDVVEQESAGACDR